jgi:hypothetical protein
MHNCITPRICIIGAESTPPAIRPVLPISQELDEAGLGAGESTIPTS